MFSHYKKLFATIAVGALVVGGFFVWLLITPKSGEDQQSACALVIDRTGSSIDKKTQATYLSLSEKMIKECRAAKASFMAQYFDTKNAKLQGGTKDPLELWRPPTRREKVGEEKLAETLKQASQHVHSIMTTSEASNTEGHGSDIVTALDLAGKSLQTQATAEGVKDKYLVFLTDGYQYKGGLSFDQWFRSPNAKVAPAIQKAKTLNLIPDLEGVKVTFAGVGGGVTSTKMQVPEWHEALVESFWTKLVEAGGGTMCSYQVEPPYLLSSNSC